MTSLTRRGRGVVLSGCALLLTGLIAENPVALAAGVFAFAVCGSAFAWAAMRGRYVRISRLPPPETTAVGRELSTIAVITVGRGCYGPALVRNLTPPGGDQDGGDAISRLDRSEVLVKRTCVTKRRGTLQWPLVGVELPDPLGLAVGIRQSTPIGSTLVFPQTLPLGRGVARAAAGAWGLDRGPSGGRSQGDPGPVPRAYEPGDEFQRMHWPATARAGKPMVRSEEPQAARTAFIAIDCSPAGYRDPDAFERAVTACASISQWLLDQGWSISVHTAQGRPLADQPWLQHSHVGNRILAALAVLQLDSSEAVVPPLRTSSGAVIAIHGAHSEVAQPPVISLCTEVHDGNTGTLMWDGTAPLSSIWASATGERALT